MTVGILVPAFIATVFGYILGCGIPATTLTQLSVWINGFAHDILPFDYRCH